MKTTLITLSALAVICQAAAATFSISNSGPITATGGSGDAIANAFNLTDNQSATQLGVYAPGGVIVDTLVVNLWSGGTIPTYASSSPTLATVTFTPGTYTVDAAGYVFLPIAGGSVSLSNTESYALSVTGYGAGPGPRNQIGATPGDSTPVYTGTAAQIDINWTGGGNPWNNYTVIGTGHNVASFSTTPVPEPETYAMLAGLGLVGFGLYRRCRK